DGIKLGKVKSDDDGLISVHALREYVAREVPKRGAQEPTGFGLDERGGELFIARAAAIYSAERLQVFRRLINELDTNEEIDEEIADQARRVIRENQQKRDKKLLDLLGQLQKGLKPGRFSGQWMKAFAQPPSDGQTTEATTSVSKQAKPPDGGTT